MDNELEILNDVLRHTKLRAGLETLYQMGTIDQIVLDMSCIRLVHHGLVKLENGQLTLTDKGNQFIERHAEKILLFHSDYNPIWRKSKDTPNA